MRIDPLEELRELEWIGRRQTGRRGVISVDELLAIGSDEGARALGILEWRAARIDLAHPSLRGAGDAELYDAVVFGCAADVLRKTRTSSASGRGTRRPASAPCFPHAPS